MTQYRGQYGVTKRSDAVPEAFASEELTSGYVLYHDSELPVAIVRDGERSAALVGHALDWRYADWTNDEVLAYLLEDWSPENVAKRSASIAGRWALLVRSGQSFALHDACGTMGVIYHQDGLASSGRLLSHLLGGLAPSPLVTPGYRNRQATGFHSGQPVAGRATEYDQCNLLLGNHWLDWDARRPVRFHPSQAYPQRNAEEVAPLAARILIGIVAAASNRKKLAIGVTAGFDSRALVAAVSRVTGLVDQTLFYTFEDEYACPPGHYDLRAGGQITEVVGGTHRAIHTDPPAGTSGRAEHMIAPRFESWAERCRSEPFEDRLVLSGWASETGRAFIRWFGSENASAEQILGCLGAKDQPQFFADIAAWHEDAVSIRDRFNVPILDLFYWEMTGSGWIRSGLNILNSGCDWLAVYSCRDLLDAMLSVREVERGGKRQILYRTIIRELNPDLLTVPFNPVRPKERMKHFIRTDLRNLAIGIADAAGLREIIKQRLK